MKSAALALVVMYLVSASIASAQSFSNGSFEDPSLPPGANVCATPGVEICPTDWTGSNTSNQGYGHQIHNDASTPSDILGPTPFGVQFVNLDHNSSSPGHAFVEQMVSGFSPGTPRTLQFAIASEGASNGHGDNNQISVTLTGAAPIGPTIFTAAGASANHRWDVWITKTLVFTPTAANVTFHFEHVGECSSGCGIGLDDVAIVPIGPTTPTPSSSLGATPTPNGSPGCGDGNVQPPETCDPPGSVAGACGQLCRADCTFCGDGVVQSGDSEQCDDGNCAECDPSHPQRPLDSCNNMCQGLICQDPAKIKLTPELDVFKFHGRLVPIEGRAMDFSGNDVTIGLTSAGDLVFRTGVPAGAIAARTNASFDYRNTAAKERGGIYKLRAKLTRDGTYKVTVTACGGLGAATEDMITHVTIGAQEWTVHGLWQRRPYGWIFPPPR